MYINETPISIFGVTLEAFYLVVMSAIVFRSVRLLRTPIFIRSVTNIKVFNEILH